MSTAAMAKVAGSMHAWTTMPVTPEAMMAETGNVANAAAEVPMFPEMLVDVAVLFTTGVPIAAPMRPAASTPSAKVSQREEWCFAEDIARDMVERSGDSRRTKWWPWSRAVAIRGELDGDCFGGYPPSPLFLF